MNAPCIKPNPTRSAGSTAVLEFMIRIHPLTARRDELLYVFSQVDTRTTDTSPLVKRFDAALSNMVKTGMLLCCGAGADREWSLGPLVLQDDMKKAKAKKATPTPDATPIPEAAPAWIGTRAPAPRHDALSCSVYQPKLWTVPRPGAQDFKAAPSVGIPC